MFKSKCLLLCLCFFVGSHATGNLVPFIDKCEWNDKSCLMASSQKAIGPFCDGLPALGVPPMDPMKLKNVKLHEGDLKVLFSDMAVTGARKLKVLKVERDINKHTLKIAGECPIEVSGEYDASGQLLFTPVTGKGPFKVICKLIYLEVNAELKTVVGPDGIKYWKIGKFTHSYDSKGKCTFHFEKLFGGNKVEAEQFTKLLNDNDKDIIKTLGKPMVNALLTNMVDHVQTFCSKVPADQLEK
ncbi:hypothetical protein PYW07_003371 [Mythimna separata]|uniref:Uncharacterized protein n=1 Tax=Mythimna separata TaxID=271217 RepID=A0AAD7YIL5_MYTSE|nr:hypothetical protein PYW07_003371 [Mythimna separata]